MAKLALKSGSAAFNQKSSSSNRINFFNGDVPFTMLNLKVPCRGLILPAYDPQFSENDPARITSVGPYRLDTMDAKGEHNEFARFIFRIECYTYYGKAWSMIVSPRAAGLPDPIQDLREHIKFRCKNDADLQNLIELPKGASKNDKVALPFPSTMGFCNAWCNPTYIPEGSTDTEERNRVLILTKTATNKLFDDLNQYRPAFMQTPNDEHWPNYKYGDVTNPACALRFATSTTTLSNGGSAACLSFGGSKPTDKLVRATVTKEMLAGRYDIDDSNVLYIPSYEELVELLLDEGSVPYDLVYEVCSSKYHGAFPKKPGHTQNPPSAQKAPEPKNEYRPAAVQEEEDDIPYGDPAPAAPQYNQPQAPTTQYHAPAPAPVAPAAGGLTPEEQKERDELAEFIRSGKCNDIATLQRFSALSAKAAAAK